jgi:catechol 2,3-dioxygenase-like lactoylglutathione lyase family enzyme
MDGWCRYPALAVTYKGGACLFDHVTVQVADVVVSKQFFTLLLAPLSIRPMHQDGEAVGFFSDSEPDGFWLGPAQRTETRELHIAFRAPTRAVVRSFHEAGVTAGGESIYEPQLFPQYHERYFAAFVRDPDGHSIEAVCHTPIEE